MEDRLLDSPDRVLQARMSSLTILEAWPCSQPRSTPARPTRSAPSSSHLDSSVGIDLAQWQHANERASRYAASVQMGAAAAFT